MWTHMMRRMQLLALSSALLLALAGAAAGAAGAAGAHTAPAAALRVSDSCSWPGFDDALQRFSRIIQVGPAARQAAGASGSRASARAQRQRPR